LSLELKEMIILMLWSTTNERSAACSVVTG
jgi:hypothetical protein